MFERKFLKKVFALSAVFMGGSVLTSSPSLAASCSSTISGSTFANTICDFDVNSSVTISSGANMGGINQDGYTPDAGQIINNGTISNSDTDTPAPGINIVSGSTLSNGIINTGTINMIDMGVFIGASTIGSVTNSGTITSENEISFYLNNNSTINGNFTNSGNIIISNVSNNNPAAIFRNNSVLNGNFNNSGTIRAYGDGNGFQMDTSSHIDGNIINSGIIRGVTGLYIDNTSSVSGNITNSGSIIGNTIDGVHITNSTTVGGDIINSGTITGSVNGILVDVATISGIITNQAGGNISGGDAGIYISSSEVGGIKNYGTITGNTYGIYSDGSAYINTYDGSVINGNVEAVNASVNYYGGQINGTVNADLFNITSGAAFNMDHAITAQTAVRNSGTLSTGTASRTINGNYIQLTGGTLKISAQNTTTYGQLAATNDVDLSQSGKINVNVVNGAGIRAGDAFNNVISSGGTLATPTDGFDVTDNSRLLTFTATSDSSSVSLTATYDPNASVSQSNSAMGNRGGRGAAAKLDQMIALNPSGDWQNVIGALNTLSSDQAIADAVNQTVPNLSGATNTALIENISTAMRIAQDQQKSNSADRNLWIKTFGSFGNQGNKDGVIGYDSKAYGIITGADKDIDDKTRLGVGVSYFNSKLISNNDNNQVNVDSFLGVIYGSYNLDDKTEANAQIAAGYNRNHSNRNINFGGLNRIANSNYDGWNFHAGTGLSHLVKLDNNNTITPQARLDYFSVTNESYEESGAGALNLHVNSQTQSQLIPALEAKANHNFTSKLSLTLNAGLGYDILNERDTVSATFANTSGAFITSGLRPSPWVVRSGAGLSWKQSADIDLTALYDRKDRGNYDDQTVSFKFHMLF